MTDFPHGATGDLDAAESLRITLDCIGDAVIATDEEGVVTRMNPVAQRLTGWSLSEAKGRPAAEVLVIVNEDTRASVENPIHHALREGITVRLPARTLLVRRDRTEIPIGDSCAPIEQGGAIRGAVLVFRDLTLQRTAEVLQENLRQQIVVADRMSSVATLAAGLAHEINNPLTYVMANIDTAIDETAKMTSDLKIDLNGLLVGAREGIARIAKIVRGVKTFSRVEEERRSVTDLVPVLDLAVDMAFAGIRDHATLVKQYGRVPFVHVDAARLGQVFINLLVNAAQSFPPGITNGNEIRIITSTDAKGRAVVEVRDTGPGIPPEILSRVFDPFFTTKPVGVGTGLGLSISHTIVVAMGGEIFADSGNHGTTLRVVLPPCTPNPSKRPTIERPSERIARPFDFQQTKETVQRLMK